MLKAEQKDCPKCSKALTKEGFLVDGYFMCDNCVVLWHESCALDIFRDAEKMKLACVCPQCSKPWEYTHFECKALKKEIHKLSDKIEHLNDEILQCTTIFSTTRTLSEEIRQMGKKIDGMFTQSSL